MEKAKLEETINEITRAINPTNTSDRLTHASLILRYPALFKPLKTAKFLLSLDTTENRLPDNWRGEMGIVIRTLHNQPNFDFNKLVPGAHNISPGMENVSREIGQILLRY